MSVPGYSGACIAAMLLAFTGFGCSDSKSDEGPTRPAQPVVSETIVPGVAGGSWEESLTLSGKITAIDLPKQRVQLALPGGEMVMYTAEQGVRNLDQLRVGDTVSATATQRLVIFVDQQSGTPSAVYAAAIARAPKGAMPGSIAAESYELVATVTAIDAASRKATLEFPEGVTRVVTVRPDVDLSRYSVGNRVVIRATNTLKVIAKSAS